MAIRLPDPFTHPDEAPGFLKAPLVDNEPILQDELPNGKVLQTKTSAQFWSVNITYPELYELEYRLVSSAINEAKRTGDSIELILPQYVNFRILGDLTACSIAAGQKGSTIEITGTNSLQGAPYLGDLFKLSTHPKVYKITGFKKEDNKFILNIYPDLFIETTGNEKPVFNTVPLQVKLMGRESISEDVNADGMYENISYSFRESL
ncbi:hypothetical protein VPT02_146 [Vibrio phage VPT02]|uniref:Distal tail protein n=1 Tax=Vibrio phage pVp-1 TaxID=1150989 RepID=H6WXP5_9CAUD|nr:distal tail protein [Vibrio phage pVp-1]AFB84011.1 hypothetical protein pVp-1_0154 [Vibrio phage pVp-1]QIG60722.1 hypothetical protein VPT02_146 [Vibrio phage VPT02]